uniref:Uncharacterized protein n=1 Tax=Arundo donax TaxID=35708 RepID=A0A0A9GIX9_ARUDO
MIDFKPQMALSYAKGLAHENSLWLMKTRLIEESTIHLNVSILIFLRPGKKTFPAPLQGIRGTNAPALTFSRVCLGSY